MVVVVVVWGGCPAPPSYATESDVLIVHVIVLCWCVELYCCNLQVFYECFALILGVASISAEL